MKKLFIMLVLLLVGFVMSAKQYVEYYRYNFSFNVAWKTEKENKQND